MSTGTSTSRTGALLAFDGGVATRFRRIFAVGLLATLWWVGTLPTVVHDRVAGWDSHAGIWLGALLLAALVVPATVGLLTGTRAVLTGWDTTGRVVGAFGRGFAATYRRLCPLVVGLFALALVLGYDVALLGPGALAPVLALAAIVAVVVLRALVASVTVLANGGSPSPLALLAEAVRGLGRRPLGALRDLALVAASVAVGLVPMIGPLLAIAAVAATSVVLVREELTAPQRRGR